MAPESLQTRTFTIKSDVWSFGVLLWEIQTHARQPYGALKPDEIVVEICSGSCLEIPQSCPATLTAAITRCWTRDPLERPVPFAFAFLSEWSLASLGVHTCDQGS